MCPLLFVLVLPGAARTRWTSLILSSYALVLFGTVFLLLGHVHNLLDDFLRLAELGAWDGDLLRYLNDLLAELGAWDEKTTAMQAQRATLEAAIGGGGPPRSGGRSNACPRGLTKSSASSRATWL